MTQATQGETGLATLPDYNIKICVPYYSDMCDEHKASKIESEKAGIKFTYLTCQSAMPALARNLLINGNGETTRKQTLTDDFSHYLFIDADIAWQPQQILDLLARRKHIISAAYIARGSSDCYQAGRWEHALGNPGELVKNTSTGVHRVNWTGAGFLLCTKPALELMEHPWFRHHLVEIDEDMEAGLVRRHSMETNEDCGFCINAVQHRVPIFLDCDTVVQHVTDYKAPPLRLSPPATHFAQAGASGKSG